MTKKYLILALAFGITAAAPGAHAYTDEFGQTIDAPAAKKKAAAETKSEDLRFSESKFKACEDVTYISKSDFKKDENFWKEAVACGVDVQVLPDSGFFSGVLRSLQSKTGFAGDKERNEAFLKKVGAKALSYLDSNIAVNGAIAACAKGGEEGQKFLASLPNSEAVKKLYDEKNCKGVLDEVKDVAEEVGPKARVEYALTKKLQSVFGMMGDGVKFLGDKANLDVRDAMDKAVLSEKEQKEVDARFAEIEKKINAKFDKEMEVYEKQKAEAAKLVGGDAPAVDSTPIAIRSRLRGEELEVVQKELMATLQKAPMLAYVSKSDRLTDAELAKAMEKVAANGLAERKKVADTLAAAESTKGLNEKAKAMMDFMHYGPVLEEVLKEDKSFCGNAQKLANALEGNKNKNMTIGIGAIVAGSVATAGLAPAFGATAGVATLAGGVAGIAGGASMMYIPDYKAMKAAEQRTHTTAHSVDGKATAGKEIGDIKDYEEARDAFVMDLATLPLDFVGAGFTPVAKDLVLSSKIAGKIGFLEKPVAVHAAKKALMKGGLPELQALKVLKDLKSADGTVQARALVQVAKALNVDTDEIKILKNLYRSGVVKDVDNMSAGRALARIRAVPEKERPAMLARMDDALKALNTAKVNPGNRDDILNAVASGAQFGVDPKRVAAVATDWDGGLDGLARTYDLARKKMELPEVRGLASTEAKQEAAFGKAIDELMEKNPQFKALKEEDRLAARSQMIGCGLNGKK